MAIFLSMDHSKKLVNFVKANYLDIGIYTSIFLIIFADKYRIFGNGYFSDSPAYINNSIMVAPLYPSIIDIFQLLLGENNIRLICMVQFIINYTIWFFACRKIFDLIAPPKETRIFCLLAAGILYSSVSTQIMSESLAYPVFFMFVAAVMQLVMRRRTGDLYKAMLVLTVLYLIRAQFVIFFPMMLLLLCTLSYFERANWLKFKLFAVFGALSLGAALFSPAFSYFMHGKFIGPQGGGLTLITAPSYFAKPEDVKYFNDEFTKSYFLTYVGKLQELNALKTCDESKWKLPAKEDVMKLAELFPNWPKENYERWYASFTDDNYRGKCLKSNDPAAITAADVNTTYGALSSFAKYNINDWTVINPVLTRIGIKLRVIHFSEWIILYRDIFFENSGGMIMAIIFMAMAAYSYSSFKKKSRLDAENIFILMTMILHISQALFISFIASAYDRYLIYTNAMAMCSVILILGNLGLYISTKFGKDKIAKQQIK